MRTNIILRKAKNFIKNPLIIIDKVKSFYNKKYTWATDKYQALNKKTYDNYSQYITHQKSKLKTIQNSNLPKYDENYREKLRGRLIDLEEIRGKESVLCLAARIGTEVRSFIDLGFFAVGLDLEPGKENKYVVCGDFHNVQFADHSVDIIFTNSLDHTYDLEKIINEIKRVLKLDGIFILEIIKGEDEGYAPGYYESLSWKKIDDVLDIFKKFGLEVIKRNDFDYPWNGQQIILKIKS